MNPSGNASIKLRGAVFSLLILSALVLPAQAKYGGGSGTEGDPYLINTAAQMNEIGADSNDWDKHFRMMADIDLSGYTGTEFNIIGTAWNNAFAGVFDGNGHTISNFTYSSTGAHNIGLFGAVSGSHDSSAIKNLGLIDPNVNAGTGVRVGALIGRFNAKISNCYVQGGTVLGSEGVGGLAGKTSGVISNCYTTTCVTGIETAKSVGGLVGSSGAYELKNCYSNCVVEGRIAVGGLVGGSGNPNGSMRNCYATGIVTGHVRSTGGLVGTHTNGGIYNCYSTAVVDGNSLVGGLVGENYKTIANCYAAGSVQGRIWVGGLVGDGTTSGTDCFWDIETTGQTTSKGGTGKTTAEMQTQTTFTNAGWDFVWESVNGTGDIWTICEGVDYPKLTWQFVIGDFDGDSDADFTDFAIFAARWLQTDSSFYCGGIDLTGDGSVNWDDLQNLVDNWLAGL